MHSTGRRQSRGEQRIALPSREHVVRTTRRDGSAEFRNPTASAVWAAAGAVQKRQHLAIVAQRTNQRGAVAAVLERVKNPMDSSASRHRASSGSSPRLRHLSQIVSDRFPRSAHTSRPANARCAFDDSVFDSVAANPRHSSSVVRIMATTSRPTVRWSTSCDRGRERDWPGSGFLPPATGRARTVRLRPSTRKLFVLTMSPSSDPASAAFAEL